MKRPQFKLNLPKLPKKIELSSFIFMLVTAGAWFGYQSLVADRVQTAQRANLVLANTIAVQLQSELGNLAQHLAELGEKKTPVSFGLSDIDLLAISVWDTIGRGFDRQAVLPQTTTLSKEQVSMLYASHVRDWERRTIAPTISGSSVYSAQTIFGPGGALYIAAPVRRSISRKVIGGYYRMDRFQRILRLDTESEASIIGSDGLVLSSSVLHKVGTKDGDLAKHIANDEVGNFRYLTLRGVSMLASYRRIPSTGLILVTAFPESLVDMSFWEVLSFGGIFVIMALMIFKSGARPSQKSAPAVERAERSEMASLLVSLWPMNQDIESIPPEAARRLFGEILKIGGSIIHECGGAFEMASTTSFFGHWPVDKSEYLVRCVLLLREEYATMNALRKNDGYETIPIVFGAAAGTGLRVGSSTEARVLGEVATSAREFARMTAQAQTDFLVSKSVWERVEHRFIGTAIGEGAYRIDGFESVTGSKVIVESAVVPELQTKTIKYLVNNGSQIIGPMTVGEIAQRLYCMDIDFECECWIEGQGQRTTIAKSGMFGGSDSVDARYWVFDWETVHGPMTEGFLRTAVMHGVMKSDHFYCVDSTALGWKSLADWQEKTDEKAA